MFTYIVFSLHCTNEKLYFVRNHKVYLKSAESACEFSHVDFLLFNVSSFPRFILFRFLSLFLLFRCSTPTLFISCFSIMAENPLSLPSFYSPQHFFFFSSNYFGHHERDNNFLSEFSNSHVMPPLTNHIPMSFNFASLIL